MPTFDATKPAANSLVSSSELRDQFNALNDSLTALTATVTTMQPTVWSAASFIPHMNGNISNLSMLGTTYSDPVTAADLNEIRDALNAIIATLQS